VTLFDEPTIEYLREQARQIGIDLTEADAAALLPGIKRHRAMAHRVRALARDGTDLQHLTEMRAEDRPERPRSP
jgi:hypothetical protein